MSDSHAAEKSRGSSRDGDGPRTGPITFYRQVVAELRKVVWPTQQELSTYFVVVMFFVLVLMAFVAFLDLGFGKLAFMVFAPDSGQ